MVTSQESSTNGPGERMLNNAGFMLGASFEATDGFLDGSLLGLLFGQSCGDLANGGCFLKHGF